MVEDRLEDAVAHHRAGRLAEAEAAYGEVLGAEPGNVRALHNLGLLLLRRKDVDRAMPLLATAFEKAPEGFPAWRAYAESLIAAERFPEAEDVLARRGEGPQGAALALRLRQAWGMALMRDGDNRAAELQFARAAELAPEDPDTHADLGLVFLRQRRAAEAAAALERAVALRPAYAGAWINLGSAYGALGHVEKAEGAYRKAVAAEPTHTAAVRNLASLLVDNGRFAEALQAVDLALEASPGNPELLLVRSQALIRLGRSDEGADACKAALEVEGLRYEALTRLGLAQMSMGLFDTALETLERAIALKPEAPEARYRRGFIRLIKRDFVGGWADYENRLRIDESISQQAMPPQLRNALELGLRRDDLAGRRILLAPEQGIGDQIMFASMLPDVARIADEVTAVFDARLIRLYANSFPDVKLLRTDVTASRSAYDRLLAIGSLGQIFRRQLPDFPGAPYLSPRPEAVARWSARLGAQAKRLRVGVSWRGGVPRTGQARRSLTLDQLRPLFALPDCEFVSLQYGDPRAEVAAMNESLENRIRVFDPEDIDDFEDLAGLIQNLDVVVSVQTAAVHLCGALGKECLTMVPYLPEWRYTLEGSTMPWYGSVRLFRQPAPAAWGPVIEGVADALRDRIAA